VIRKILKRYWPGLFARQAADPWKEEVLVEAGSRPETREANINNMYFGGEYKRGGGEALATVGSTCVRLGTEYGAAKVLSAAAGGVVWLGRYRLSGTVARHLDDLVARGPFKGERARPFLVSQQLLQELIATGKAVPDPRGVPGALRWDVPGTFRGAEGIWELVIDMNSKTILHWNFVTP
jgi:hypothetical protein